MVKRFPLLASQSLPMPAQLQRSSRPLAPLAPARPRPVAARRPLAAPTVVAKKGGEPPRRELQLNPGHVSYWRSRGYSSIPPNWQSLAAAEAARKQIGVESSDRANQLNPSHAAYWMSRGYSVQEARDKAASQSYSKDDC